jgi:hypothetical protein
MSWRNPAAVIVVSAMLFVAGFASMIAAGDLNEASDGQATASALTRAAANMELAWYQLIGADALAATGAAPAEAQGFYDAAIELYNESKAVLSAAGVEQIDQAVAGSDQGLAGMTQAFQGTLQLAASGDIAAATQSHLQNTGAIYEAVDPALEGLMTIAGIADSRLQESLDSGAGSLRLLGIFSLIIASLGAAFAAYSGWTVYQQQSKGEAGEKPQQMSKAA